VLSTAISGLRSAMRILFSVRERRIQTFGPLTP
jgi:hypothetical protein